MLSVPSFPPIIGLDWAYEGDELEIITLDGVVYDVAVSDEGLEVKENRTTDLYNGLIKHGAFEPVADDEQGGAEESQRPATTNAGAPQVVVPPAAIISKDTDKTTVLRPYPTQARVYGLCKTRFGLLEAVHLGLASLVDVEFLIATRTVSYVLFMPRGSTTRDLLKLLRQDLDDPSLCRSFHDSREGLC